MKKFIAAFDGLDFSEVTMTYAISLAKNCNAHLVGVFLEDFTRHSYGIAEMANYNDKTFDQNLRELNDKDNEERVDSIAIFDQACMSAGLNYSVHRDRNVAMQELLHESIYSDLLIIGADESLTRFDEKPPSRFIRELLNDIQCPVLLVPSQYQPIDQAIMLYDGEPSSVHAVRSFSYLMNLVFSNNPEIISVKGKEESLHMPDNRLIKEFIKRHYPQADYVVLKGYAEDEIVQYLLRKKNNPVVVLGAYRRSRFSRIFRPSMADVLLQHLQMPLFIAHNKS